MIALRNLSKEYVDGPRVVRVLTDLDLEIDIKPRSATNPVHPFSRSVIWTDPRPGRTIPAPGTIAEGGHSACQRR